MNYTIGQILFIVSRDSPDLFPVKVVEENIKKTLTGNNVSYIVLTIDNKLIQLNDINGDVFVSAIDAQKVIIEKVTQTINNVVQAAIAASKIHFLNDTENLLESVNSPQEMVDLPKSSNLIPQELLKEIISEPIILPDGQVAKIRSIS